MAAIKDTNAPIPNVKVYDNFVLANEIEDQFNSHLDLQRFTTVDTTLEGTNGMKKIVHRYKATEGTEKLKRGEGNSLVIGTDYDEDEYEIQLAQNRFAYYDEDLMTDPMVVQTGVGMLATDMFNTTNSDVMTEYLKATLVHKSTVADFAAFVRAKAKLLLPEDEASRNRVEIFAFVNPTQEAEIAILLGDSLKYVEAFVRNGYIGTVAGINLYEKWDAPSDKIVIATKKAVTTFIKKGTEVEQERDTNVRKNTIYSRKYYVEALTDATQVVILDIAAES
jgi:hypothetical protein